MREAIKKHDWEPLGLLLYRLQSIFSRRELNWDVLDMGLHDRTRFDTIESTRLNTIEHDWKRQRANRFQSCTHDWETLLGTIETPSLSFSIVFYRFFFYKRSRPDRSLEMLKDFPLIWKLFLLSNTPLPSSAAVECLFSYATLMDIPKFKMLTDAHFEGRVLFKANAAKANAVWLFIFFPSNLY